MRRKLNTCYVGRQYETMAFDYLKRKGYKFVARNVRNKCGELDGIFMDGETFVFVEVKFRRDRSHGDPLDFVDYKKRRRISRASTYYLIGHGKKLDTPCRFDCIGITGDGHLKHIKNAFGYTP